MTAGVPSLLFVPAGKALLLGAFGIALFRSVRGESTTQIAFERLVVAVLALSQFDTAALYLDIVSADLAALIGRIGDHASLKAFLLDLFERSSRQMDDIPGILEQVWRTGVWGVMSGLVEGAFLIVSFVLECAQEVLWKLILLLFPLAAGVYPVFPRILLNLAIYAVELSLWIPMLLLVELVTASVARGHLSDQGSLGFYIVAIQVVAILLILMIPAVTHKFLSGAFAGDFNFQSGVFDAFKRMAMRVPGGASK